MIFWTEPLSIFIPPDGCKKRGTYAIILNEIREFLIREKIT